MALPVVLYVCETWFLTLREEFSAGFGTGHWNTSTVFYKTRQTVHSSPIYEYKKAVMLKTSAFNLDAF